MATFPEIYDQILKSVSSTREAQDWSSTSDVIALILSKVNQHQDLEKLARKIRDKKVPKFMCEGFREKAKKSFQDKNYELALALYSKLIEFSHECEDEPSGKDLIYQGFCNRSATLFRMGSFRECLEDVEAALCHSKGNKADYLLHERKARCLLGLGSDIRQAEECFRVSLELAKQAQVGAQMLEAMEKKMKQFLDSPRKEAVPQGSQISSLSVVNMASMEQNTDICYEPELGRFLRARRNIEPGEVVIFEDPLVAFTQCDAQTKKSKACHHCMNSLGRAPFPSPIVKGIYFCSWTCVQSALEGYHKHEAIILSDYVEHLNMEISSTSGVMFLALRAVVLRPWAFYMSPDAQEIAKNSDTQFTVRDQKDELLHRDEAELRFLTSLVDHESHSDPSERLQIAVRAVILAKSLAFTHYVHHAEGELEFLSQLLYRFQLSIAYNIHSVYHVGGNISGDIPLEQVGSALYKEAVYLNHSCSPNTSRFFLGNKIILVAKRVINKGEEVSNNYGIHHEQMSRDQRRSLLRNKYKFECGCEACERDLPILPQIPISLPKGLGKQLDRLLQSYQRSFQNGDLTQARMECERYLKKLHRSGVVSPHKNYNFGSIALNSCWWAMIAQESETKDAIGHL
ncbi:hypothetical protein TCAL_07236 [Tigriopus californicus]|uniref:SET domain-containing protein n=1 Tax=Tigriopus californicus TaxID=6832 RepID=A0A553NTB8_TIGCA|nr:SET and MYND domain-containing protein 4-like [Tigriopus californicus]TRY68682.1 hypothetical protein TCAL_07236 [Tigriopus californicus]|eukprot:TCALIF_07236-PA protein Name:"Similar to SMYD4 SET and MYND domain-containing protein 4 (Pongo abelii)" AED:0.02 eAED:0.06 QI:0/-1/0/1/-1/1/1/0/627